MNRENNPGCLGLIAAIFGIKPQAQPKAEKIPYRLRDDFLSPAEISFYHVVQSTVGEDFTVCPKVNLADIFFVSQPNENQAARNRIDRKHVDFLVCDSKTMRPRLGLELDDASHSRQNRIDRDTFFDEVFKTANLPLLRFPVQHAYTVSEVSAKLSAVLGAKPQPPPCQQAHRPQPEAPPCARSAKSHWFSATASAASSTVALTTPAADKQCQCHEQRCLFSDNIIQA